MISQTHYPIVQKATKNDRLKSRISVKFNFISIKALFAHFH